MTDCRPDLNYSKQYHILLIMLHNIILAKLFQEVLKKLIISRSAKEVYRTFYVSMLDIFTHCN